MSTLSFQNIFGQNSPYKFTARFIRNTSWSLITILTILQGCTAVNTFPTVARAGGTISIMVGGSEAARTSSVSALLTDSNSVVWDLQATGAVRSVFNLRSAGTANGLHYSSWLDTEISWLNGHEPVQTVMVMDIPVGASIGPASLEINLNVSDDSSGINSPFTTSLDIIAGTGSTDDFLRQNFNGVPRAASLTDLEAAPYAKVSFGDGSTPTGSQTLGAASLVIDFDETIVNGDDLNVYVSESTVRGSFSSNGAFGDKQRMVAWHQDGSQLFINIVAPFGIAGRYLQVFVIHPRGLSGNPNLSIVNNTVYDLDGNPIVFTPTLSYHQ